MSPTCRAEALFRHATFLGLLLLWHTKQLPEHAADRPLIGMHATASRRHLQSLGLGLVALPRVPHLEAADGQSNSAVACSKR